MADQPPAPVTRTLERVAALHGDPVDLVYAELFRRHPETEALFLLDRDGAVRGNMLANVIDVLLDWEADQRYGRNLLRAELQNHGNLGVEPELFLGFFAVLETVVARVLGPEWTQADAAAWRELIASVRAET